jgi:hypothetical protein
MVPRVQSACSQTKFSDTSSAPRIRDLNVWVCVCAASCTWNEDECTIDPTTLPSQELLEWRAAYENIQACADLTAADGSGCSSGALVSEWPMRDAVRPAQPLCTIGYCACGLKMHCRRPTEYIGRREPVARAFASAVTFQLLLAQVSATAERVCPCDHAIDRKASYLGALVVEQVPKW